jgi:hypothetical protein
MGVCATRRKFAQELPGYPRDDHETTMQRGTKSFSGSSRYTALASRSYPTTHTMIHLFLPSRYDSFSSSTTTSRVYSWVSLFLFTSDAVVLLRRISGDVHCSRLSTYKMGKIRKLTSACVDLFFRRSYLIIKKIRLPNK